MDDVLVFHARAAPKAVGSGTHEHVADPRAYAALEAVPQWRRVLSNLHTGEPFMYRGRRYHSIEHAFQATKIGLVDTSAALRFSLDSGDVLARSDGVEARKARKCALLPPGILAAWDATSNTVMADIARAKYAQDGHARAVLLATGSAQLWHFVSRAPAGRNLVRFAHLEALRAALRDNG